MTTPVRVRFAPSPTGTLHVGGARTAIYNWAFARKSGGTFILRIDDTDPERSTAENTAQILRSLTWLGIDWDEGPEVGGEYGPYFQTQRADNYRAALETMKANGTAYPCFCSAETLEGKREAARQSGSGISGYDRTCRALTAEDAAARVEAGEPHVWRLAVPLDHGPVVVDDAVRGLTEFPIEAMDDFVLARTDGTPTYNFATVIDDADMEISHVIRGDDHLANTPRQILVFEALGHTVPRFAHLSMIWGPDGKKLSKRHGATSVEAYDEMGYLPEALLNYLALLGWSLDGETTIVPADVLKANFSLERISKNPAIFDIDKLEWMNGSYIRDMSADELISRLLPWLERAGLATAADVEARHDWFVALIPLVAERLKHLDEIAPMVRFLFEEPEIDEASLAKVLRKEGAGTALSAVAEALKACDWSSAAIEETLRGVPETIGLKPKVVFQAVRVAATGSTVSPPLFESLELLGRARSLARIQAAHELATT
ncbi:MAG TPA: glutamate--tRNA ligase [Coriobacteriia bacterium]|nr:glutamate--tRNA ligase [Coriobacteriia bacterium]